MDIIGYVYTDFDEKFGIPRQSGIVKELTGTIVFLPEYRQPEAFRGLEDFTYIWILWEFHKAKRENWSATVKPPKLGGNKRMASLRQGRHSARIILDFLRFVCSESNTAKNLVLF